MILSGMLRIKVSTHSEAAGRASHQASDVALPIPNRTSLEEPLWAQFARLTTLRHGRREISIHGAERRPLTGLSVSDVDDRSGGDVATAIVRTLAGCA